VKLVFKPEMKDVIYHVKEGMLSVKPANGVQNLLQLVKCGKKLNLNLKLLTNFNSFKFNIGF